MNERKMSRRQVLGSASRIGERLAGAQASSEPPNKSVPLEELVNSLEFEEQARHLLPEDVFSSIAGSDRSVFDRITFRPRMNVSTLDMDLSLELFDERLFTPIVVGPISNQKRYHPEGEMATVAGAAAAKAVAIVSSHSSVPIESIGERAEETKNPFWVAVYAEDDAPSRAKAAVDAGATTIFVTVHAAYQSASNMRSSGPSVQRQAEIDWRLVEAIQSAVSVPVVLKGVTSQTDASMAVDQGLDGIVVSNFGGLLGTSPKAPIDELITIADTVGNRLPILVDGSFRRATDILAALILGARAVLLGRPVMWALASYGADGVKTLVQMLQSDLARCFAMLGASTPSALIRNHVKLHRR